MPDFFGTMGTDTITGTSVSDTIYALGGLDTIDAGDGDDLVVLTAQLTAFGNINGGAGIDTLRIDRSYIPTSAVQTSNVFGQTTPMNLTIASFGTSTLTSFERLAFNSLAGDVFSVGIAYGGNGGALNQIGSGLAANAELIGGAGIDQFNLSYASLNQPGSVTAPVFTYTNWLTPDRAYQPADVVAVSVTGTGATNVFGSFHSAGVMGLQGGGGNDFIVGTAGLERINYTGGIDMNFAGAGNDAFAIVNTYSISPAGVVSAETTRTGGGSLFNGEDGIDFLVFGGNVNFSGVLQNIEGIMLLQGFTNLNNPAQPILVGSQYEANVIFASATFAQLPSNLIIDGIGGITINFGNAGETFNGQGFVFENDALTSVGFSINGGSGNDTITGTAVTDFIDGGAGNDMINGGSGDDYLSGGGGLDALDGGSGDDLISVGNGLAVDTNSYVGGADHDILALYLGTVAMTGSVSGFEEIYVGFGATLTMAAAQVTNGLAANTVLDGNGALRINMFAGDSELYLQGFTGFLAGGITVTGTADNDVIKGVLGSANTINGGNGADLIRGGQQADIMNGGDGNDKIEGGQGADILTGGTGADQFRFQSVNASGVGLGADQITDFVAGQDRLGFALIDTDLVAAGDQGFAFIGTGAFSATGAAEIRYGNSGGDILVQADVNGDGVVDMEIILQGIAGQTLTGGDFVL